MADLGFLPAVTRILDATPPDGQRMFFSATLDRGVGQLVTSYVSDPALHAVPAATDSRPAEHRDPGAARGGQGAGRGGDRQPPGTDAVLRPDQARRGPAREAAVPGRGRAPRPSTATATRTSASGRWTRSPPGIPGSWSPPTSPPAASTSTTSTWSCSSTRRTTTRTTCTAPAARPGPAPPAWSSRWSSAGRSATCERMHDAAGDHRGPPRGRARAPRGPRDRNLGHADPARPASPGPPQSRRAPQTPAAAWRPQSSSRQIQEHHAVCQRQADLEVADRLERAGRRARRRTSRERHPSQPLRPPPRGRASLPQQVAEAGLGQGPDQAEGPGAFPAGPAPLQQPFELIEVIQASPAPARPVLSTGIAQSVPQFVLAGPRAHRGSSRGSSPCRGRRPSQEQPGGIISFVARTNWCCATKEVLVHEAPGDIAVRGSPSPTPRWAC